MALEFKKESIARIGRQSVIDNRGLVGVAGGLCQDSEGGCTETSGSGPECGGNNQSVIYASCNVCPTNPCPTNACTVSCNCSITCAAATCITMEILGTGNQVNGIDPCYPDYI